MINGRRDEYLVIREKTGAGCSWFSLFYFIARWETTIKVVVTGAAGRMGREMTRGLLQWDKVRVVGAVDCRKTGEDIGTLCGLKPVGINIHEDLEYVINAAGPQVMVDFTVAEAAVDNVRLCVKKGVRSVIGTTGLSLDELDELHGLCEEKGIGTIVAPNFSMGAVLMMHFARKASRFFPSAEIVELHHDQKIDAPSGTALKTAELIALEGDKASPAVSCEEKVPGVRGINYKGTTIHSIRLPGALAHQEVIFGGRGELLTLRHDTTSREAFLSGLFLAVERVMELKGMVYGLENLLDF